MYVLWLWIPLAFPIWGCGNFLYTLYRFLICNSQINTFQKSNNSGDLYTHVSFQTNPVYKARLKHRWAIEKIWHFYEFTKPHCTIKPRIQVLVPTKHIQNQVQPRKIRQWKQSIKHNWLEFTDFLQTEGGISGSRRFSLKAGPTNQRHSPHQQRSLHKHNDIGISTY